MAVAAVQGDRGRSDRNAHGNPEDCIEKRRPKRVDDNVGNGGGKFKLTELHENNLIRMEWWDAGGSGLT